MTYSRYLRVNNSNYVDLEEVSDQPLQLETADFECRLRRRYSRCPKPKWLVSGLKSLSTTTVALPTRPRPDTAASNTIATRAREQQHAQVVRWYK